MNELGPRHDLGRSQLDIRDCRRLDPLICLKFRTVIQAIDQAQWLKVLIAHIVDGDDGNPDGNIDTDWNCHDIYAQGILQVRVCEGSSGKAQCWTDGASSEGNG